MSTHDTDHARRLADRARPVDSVDELLARRRQERDA
jgi:hypothetical protein